MIKGADAAAASAVVVVAGGTAAGAAAVSPSSALGPILAFVGVIFVAVLTASSTKRRQAEQLHAENQRQCSVLTAGSGRLRQQLDHQRQLADLAEVRSILDDAVQSVEVARYLWLDLHEVVVREPYDREEAERLRREYQRSRRASWNLP